MDFLHRFIYLVICVAKNFRHEYFHNIYLDDIIEILRFKVEHWALFKCPNRKTDCDAVTL